jgi:serine/threonine protein kinase
VVQVGPASRQYRAVERLGRWSVGNAYIGEILPGKAPCTIIFVDVVGPEVKTFIQTVQSAIQENHLLAGLPILTFQHVGETVDHKAFVVLPRITGRSLRDYIDAAGPMKPPAALQVGVVLADMLARLHARGRVLGEIRPSSVLLPRNRAEGLRVVDFGVVRGLFEGAITPPEASKHFTSLHVRGGGEPRPVDDIYALAAVVSYLIAGVPPGKKAKVGVSLGPLAPFLDGLLVEALAAPDPNAGSRVQDARGFARWLRGMRDLHRLSPSAQKAVLSLRPEGKMTRPPPMPGSEPAVAELGFVETASPFANIPTLTEEPILLPDEALTSIEQQTIEAQRKARGESSDG